MAISFINVFNRRSGPAESEDRFGFLAISLSVLVAVFLAVITWRLSSSVIGLGNAEALRPLLGWFRCACLVPGIAIHLAAVVTLRRQYTTVAIILAQHRIVDGDPYRRVRHPANLGLLLSLLGFELCSGNGVSLAVAIELPLAAIVYGIRVEEQVLLRHFDPVCWLPLSYARI